MRRLGKSLPSQIISRFLCLQFRLLSTNGASPLRIITRPHGQEHGSHLKIQIRGAKRKTAVKINAPIFQGALSTADHVGGPAEEDEPAYSPAIQQHLNNMRKFPDCVILTKMGNFYELYFEQAAEYAPLLGIKLAKKPTTRNVGGFLYMAGFPFYQLDRYLKILVNDLGKHVAIADEKRNDESQRMKSGGNLFERNVVRIITPGTLIDEKFMDPWQNNWLLSIYVEPDQYAALGTKETDKIEMGLAWVDLSSGDFFLERTDMSRLPSAIARIGPKEVILDKAMESSDDSVLLKSIAEGHYSVAFTTVNVEPGSSPIAQSDWLAEAASSLESRKFSNVEAAAGKLIVQYIDRTQLQREGVSLQPPIPRQEDEYMMIDKHSLRALEITETLRDGNYKGSLLHAIRRTVTQSGTRLLQQRLKAPSMSLDEINGRLDLANEMLQYPVLRDDIISLLRTSYDSLRIVTKFGIGKGDADDLLQLARTVTATAQIAARLEKHVKSMPIASSACGQQLGKTSVGKPFIENLLGRLSLRETGRLAERIVAAIDEVMLEEQHQIEMEEEADIVRTTNNILEEAGEDPLKRVPKHVQKTATNPGEKDAGIPANIWIMRREASPRLSSLHDELDAVFVEKDELEETWRAKTGAKTLSLRWMPNQGHVVHISGARNLAMDFSILGKTTTGKSLKSTRSFYHHEWTDLGHKIEKVKEMARSEENRVFEALRKLVINSIVRLRRNAVVLDELDVACGFATLAEEKGWIRPLLNNGSLHHIRGGRHPTVESGLIEQGKKFMSNDCTVGGNEQIMLITGPNMGGKSTFLRQNALLSILAQTGSFVPAEYAEIGLVDKIFSRVGSADNLYQDQSTFMVEMLETAQILKQATPKSFVIMDEVGRGTTPEDGIAVGFAALSHLYEVNQCRALFATHFHVLTDMTKDWDKLACYCTDVAEEMHGSFYYLHKLRKGINRNPHAMKVARLAGMPAEAISVAEQVLAQIKVSTHPPFAATTQMHDRDTSSDPNGEKKVVAG